MAQVSSLKTGIKYKDTPIGKIPVDWEVVRLGELAAPIKNAFSDGPFGSNLKLEDYVDSGIPVLQGKNITKNRLEWVDIRYVPKKKAEEHSRSLTTVGDILMTKIGTVGCVAIVNDLKGYDYSLIPANLMKITLNKNKVDTNFLYQFLLWPITKKRIVDISSQTAQPALNLKAMKAFEIACPPIPEQKKIAEILSTVDEAIEKTDQIIEKTREVKKGLMQKLLTRGIGHKKFEKTAIEEIPEEWEVKKLSEVAAPFKNAISDGPFGSNLKLKDYVDSGIPVLQGKNITKNRLDWFDIRYVTKEKAKEHSRSLATVGDILMTKIGTVGCVAIVDSLKGHDHALIPANLMKISLDNKKVDTNFLYQFLTWPITRKKIVDISSQTAQPALSLKTMKAFKITCPPLLEQKQIAEILSSVDQEIKEETTHKDQLELLKKGLMQVLLTGKIRVAV